MTNGSECAEIGQARLRKTKKAFTTRRIPERNMAVLIDGDVSPEPGDLVLARVDQLGHHSKLELIDGRRAQMHVGDEIVVSFGNRYAPDQFEAIVDGTLSPCDLAAAGGIAATVRHSHDRTRKPTKIIPVGLIGGRDQRPLNLRDFAFEPATNPNLSIPTIAVVGTAMNSGKTFAAAQLIKGLERAGYRPGAAKVTGTGSGGDLWQMQDAGAVAALDFTDAGYASTYLVCPGEVENIWVRLVGKLAEQGADIAVVEVADGLFQKESKSLIGSDFFRQSVQAVVFCGGDSVGAVAGTQWLSSQALPLKAITGLMTRSPLAIREVRGWTSVPVIETGALSEPFVGRGVWDGIVGDPEDGAMTVGGGALDDRLNAIQTRLAG